MMKEFKGTKGEWKIEYDNSEYCESYLIETEKEHICTIDFGYNHNNLSVINANAKLIAAAPDLLEALQNILTVFEESEQAIPVSSQMKIEKAINKALN